MGRLLASFLLCLVLATGAKANCYVLQNNTDYEQKWAFSYNTPVGPGQLKTLTLAPHDHYPSQGQWCWNDVPWKVAVRVVPGAYRRSWSGALTMGDGDEVSPSGTYALEPPADVPPPPPKAQAPASAKAQKRKSTAFVSTGGASTASASAGAAAARPAATGSAPAISCVNGACGVLFQNGHVAYTDANQPTAAAVAAIAGFQGPGSISCTAQPAGELCVVIDSTGQTWKGPMRPGAGAWTSWTKPPRD